MPGTERPDTNVYPIDPDQDFLEEFEACVVRVLRDAKVLIVGPDGQQTIVSALKYLGDPSPRSWLERSKTTKE
ncbi:MAG: hypothetical protein WC498_04345 [Candidatus Saccharimonadales bacterium]